MVFFRERGENVGIDSHTFRLSASAGYPVTFCSEQIHGDARFHTCVRTEEEEEEEEES